VSLTHSFVRHPKKVMPMGRAWCNSLAPKWLPPQFLTVARPDMAPGKEGQSPLAPIGDRAA